MAVGLFLGILIVGYVTISYLNDRRKEKKGICKTTGGTCTSPTGCTCGDAFEKDEH